MSSRINYGGGVIRGLEGRYDSISHLSKSAFCNARHKLHAEERKNSQELTAELKLSCRPSEEVYICKNCQIPFIAKIADRKRGWARFCTKTCKAQKQNGG